LLKITQHKKEEVMAATKKQIIEKLTELKVDFDPNLPKNELENLLAEKADAIGAAGADDAGAGDAEESRARRPEDLARQAKNFADPADVDSRIGVRNVTTTSNDQEIKVITKKDELLKLQEAGQLVHYDPETGEAAIKPQRKLDQNGNPAYMGRILVDRRI
jgi:hypothetical protein